MKTAIVTIAIGAAYSARFRAHCEGGWSRYADRHGFQLIVIEAPLDLKPRAAARSPAWQKCLVLRPDVAGSFDRVIWIDADILINDSAPSMALTQQAEAVNPGLAKTWATYLDPADWHAAWGLPRSGRSIVQTGVLVLAPKHHRELLEHVYYSYEGRGGEPMNYEMRPLSCEIQKAGPAARAGQPVQRSADLPDHAKADAAAACVDPRRMRRSRQVGVRSRVFPASRGTQGQRERVPHAFDEVTG
jgi:hypothetical protein